jgi:anti-sigma28 factor (negative regulator of flagellin synthesis)
MSSIQSIQPGLIPAARLSVRRADDAPAAAAPTAPKTDSVELSTTRRLPYDQIADQGFNSAKVDKIRREQQYSAFVRVAQKGTANYRLRFAIRVAGKPADTPVEKVVVLSSDSEEFQVDVPFEPRQASLVLLGYTLGTAGEPMSFP